MATQSGASRLFVRNSTGLVRSASALDATIFNAVISAPIGSTLAYSIFFTLVAFPGADVVGVLILTAIINIPILIMFALLASSMPRVGGDYVWVSRVLNPPLALISNLCMIAGGLLGAAFFAKFFSIFALGPVLVGLGTLLGNNSTLIDWGTNFQTNQGWMLGGALFVVLLQTVILIRGTKATFRFQNGAFFIGMAGIVVAFIVLLIGSHTDFANNFNSINHSFGGGTLNDVVDKAGAAGAKPDFFNWSATWPTLFSIQGFLMWNFWSAYMSGELKSASNRRRQLTTMFGALIFDVVLLIIGAALLFKVLGYETVYALNAASPAYAIPSGPFYHFLAALVYNAPILTVVILGSFLFWSLPSMIANTFMPIRSFFAWSFDRLMPERLASINEHTHSPVVAILVANLIIALLVIWSVFSNSFQLVLGLIVLAGALAVVIVGVAAVALPYRRPDLYRASPANVSFLGVPVLVISGVLSILIFIGIAIISTQYPALVMAGDTKNFWWIPAWFGGLIVGGALLYYIPKAIRARQGINIGFVYKELPPE